MLPISNVRAKEKDLDTSKIQEDSKFSVNDNSGIPFTAIGADHGIEQL